MLAHQDTSDEIKNRARLCEGDISKCCGVPAAGPDPCQGCKERAFLDYRPAYPITEYCFHLDWCVRNLTVGLEDLGWDDVELLQVFQGAQAEHEREKYPKEKE